MDRFVEELSVNAETAAAYKEWLENPITKRVAAVVREELELTTLRSQPIMLSRRQANAMNAMIFGVVHTLRRMMTLDSMEQAKPDLESDYTSVPFGAERTGNEE